MRGIVRGIVRGVRRGIVRGVMRGIVRGILRGIVRGVMRGDGPGEQREEVAAGVELHHQVETLTVLERVVQLCDPLAVGLRHDVSLLLVERHLVANTRVTRVMMTKYFTVSHHVHCERKPDRVQYHYSHKNTFDRT